MRKFQVTVNGSTYEVEVEEIKGNFKNTQTVAKPLNEIKKEVRVEKTNTGASGGQVIKSPMPGKIIDTKVKVGDSIKEGDLVAVLEAMKMENEIFSSVTGTVAAINVSVGASVEADDIIITVAI